MPSIEQLEKLLDGSPDDTFLLYALAMELDNCGQHERSLEIFAGLTRRTPPYIPAFFMSGQQFVRLGRIDEAKVRLSAGIEQAKLQNDSHARGEMTDFLASIDEL